MEEHKGDYKIIKNEIFSGIRSDTKIIYYNCEITDFHLENSTTLKECLFIDCHLKSMKIRKIKNVDNLIRFTFLDCRINELHIEESEISNIRFFNSEIFNSRFEYSTLPGMIFSKNIPRELQKKQAELQEEEQTNQGKKESPWIKELDLLSVHNTEFLICHLNDMRIDNIKFTDTSIKHCNIVNFEIVENVRLKNIDLRGSKFLKSDFGKCKFKKIKFTGGFFPGELLFSLFWPLKKILWYIFKLVSGKRPHLKDESRMHFRNSIKRFLYKIKLGFLADFSSSTDCQQEVRYKEADFSEDYYFFWHIQDLDFIHNLKLKHPIFAGFTFWTSNYMRSFGALAFFSFFVVWVFSLLFSTNWVNLGEIPHNYCFYLSFKIFTNFGIDPLDAKNFITKILIIFEIIIGYFALGTLLSIILFPFARRTSLPGSLGRGHKS